MRTTYFDEDDILVLRLSDKQIVRETSQDWNTHVSYAADGTAAIGAYPFEVLHGEAA